MSRIAAFLLAAALLAAPAAAQTRFLAEAEDIPLPPALEESVFGASFAGADGRLLETSAQGEATPAAVRAFYESALPSLGWSQAPSIEGPLIFQRGRERLTISIAAMGAAVRVRYRLVSRGASMALD